MTKHTIGKTEVHTFPLPPKDFRPLEASAEDLQRYGFPKRPDHAETPQAAARWVKAFTKYPSFEHIEPRFQARRERRTPNHRTEKGTQGQLNATSYNWSGLVVFVGGGDHFTWINGSWTVPHTYPAPGGGTGYCSAWLGIDGDGSSDVMQAGTESDSDGTCYAWFEWYPNYSIGISNFGVVPGDVINLLLCASNSTTAWMSIGNLTSKQYTNFSFTAPNGTALVGNCAEAVVERPEVNGAQATLPRYGEVFFDDVAAYTANGLNCPIGLGTPISMVANDGTTVISAPEVESNTDSARLSYTGP
jgi:hypothetical protein